jgi:transcription-repair coupling factor (superfamily II helicase)
MTIERQECIERLLRCGYHQVDLVEEWGDFGVRGGIIDFFPPHLPRPIRLEFMGDEIESLREFDLATQRSLRPVEQATIVPLREFIKDLPPWDEIEAGLATSISETPGDRGLSRAIYFPPGWNACFLCSVMP